MDKNPSENISKTSFNPNDVSPISKMKIIAANKSKKVPSLPKYPNLQKSKKFYAIIYTN